MLTKGQIVKDGARTGVIITAFLGTDKIWRAICKSKTKINGLHYFLYKEEIK